LLERCANPHQWDHRADETGWSGVGNPLRFVEPAKNAAHPPKVSDPSAPPRSPESALIDFGVFVAGPYAVEAAGRLRCRRHPGGAADGRSTLSGERTIISANHGKRSICIDAKSEAGRALVAVLCKDADVVFAQFQARRRRSAVPRSAFSARPQSCGGDLETTAYGATGPKSPAPGFDMVMQAHCGLGVSRGRTDIPLCCARRWFDFATARRIRRRRACWSASGETKSGRRLP